MSQYEPLVNKGPWVDITLHNTTSVIVFTDACSKPSKTDKMIHIDPTLRHLNEPQELASLQLYLLNDLDGSSMSKETQESRNPRKLYYEWKCTVHWPSSIHLGGSSRLQDIQNIPTTSQRLNDLRLQGVLVDTEQAVSNLEDLIRMNSDLTRPNVTLATTKPDGT